MTIKTPPSGKAATDSTDVGFAGIYSHSDADFTHVSPVRVRSGSELLLRPQASQGSVATIEDGDVDGNSPDCSVDCSIDGSPDAVLTLTSARLHTHTQ